MNNKLVLAGLLFTNVLFATENFKKDISYTCINTHVLQQGQKIDIKKKEAEKNPFVFTIKKDKLYTQTNAVFDYKMSRGDMSSYSNADYMLLLTKNLELGLVPRKSRGQIQYYFKCENN